MTPHGPRAAEIAQLAWFLFAVGTAVLVLVFIVLSLAVRGAPGIRSRLAGERMVVAGGLVLPAVTLTGLLAYDVAAIRADLRPTGAERERIEVVGEQWWWRIAYAGRDGTSLASANEIRIPVNREVEFSLTSADVIHSFWVPSLAGKVDMIPGRTTRLRVMAERPGIYRGQCAEYCGGAHALMAMRIIAMPAIEFDAWKTAAAAAAAAPAGETEGRGQSLFLAAGCGACHTVRGTSASGTVGPDLTHVGARRSIGADVLPMTAANLARFVADGQHVKPGNAMPQFRIFSGSDLAALAAYLLSLR